jgi:hypothetical protein
VVWSAAEGRKGRRWREVRLRDGVVLSSLLLETFPDRHFAHTELSTGAGLLTLHPEPDGTLHGNVVTSGGIEHIAGVAWPNDCLLVVHGSPISLAAAAWQLKAEGGDAEPGRRPIVTIDPKLRITPGNVPTDALARHPIDEDGLPILEDQVSWPLEIEAG